MRAPLRIVQDDALATLVARGDAAAEAELFHRHHRAIVGFCRSILLDANEADEAAQAAFVKALDALRRRPLDAPLRPWLFRIAHNESINLIRHRRRHDGLESAPPSVVPAADVAADQRERLHELVRDLQALPERQRSALLMREMSGFSYAEIATTLSATEQAVRQSVFEARQTLVEFREGRQIECSSVRSVLQAGDRRVLRGKRMRAHLRGCPDCEALREGVATRRRDLRLLLPALPVSGLAAVLGTGGSGGVIAAGAVKLAVGSLAAVTATVGVVEIKRHAPAPTHPRIAALRSEPNRPAPRRHAPRIAVTPRAAPAASPQPAVPAAFKGVHRQVAAVPATPAPQRHTKAAREHADATAPDVGATPEPVASATPEPAATSVPVSLKLPVGGTTTRTRVPGVDEIVANVQSQAQAQTQQALTDAQAYTQQALATAQTQTQAALTDAQAYTQQALANARQAMESAQSQMATAMSQFGQHGTAP